MKIPLKGAYTNLKISAATLVFVDKEEKKYEIDIFNSKIFSVGMHGFTIHIPKRGHFYFKFKTEIIKVSSYLMENNIKYDIGD